MTKIKNLLGQAGSLVEPIIMLTYSALAPILIILIIATEVHASSDIDYICSDLADGTITRDQAQAQLDDISEDMGAYEIQVEELCNLDQKG